MCAETSKRGQVLQGSALAGDQPRLNGWHHLPLPSWQWATYQTRVSVEKTRTELWSRPRSLVCLLPGSSTSSSFRDMKLPLLSVQAESGWDIWEKKPWDSILDSNALLHNSSNGSQPRAAERAWRPRKDRVACKESYFKISIRDWAVAPLVECWPSMHEAC